MLRDNGGPTLTRSVAAGSPAVDPVPPVPRATCSTINRWGLIRGRIRPVGATCDIGAVEYGLEKLIVCQNCENDRLGLRFANVQTALNHAMAGDTVAVEAGRYTGNFIAYKDVTLAHAGIDVSLLNRDQPTDVRAILQASDLTIRSSAPAGRAPGQRAFRLGADHPEL